MKAIILAAGNSTRTQPLTDNKPKCLLKAGNKSVLQHNLEQLNSLNEFDEVIIVVGFGKELVEQHVEKLKTEKEKDNNFNFKISFVEQKEINGTGAALKKCENLKEEEMFLVLNGDDFFSGRDLEKVINDKKRNCVLLKEVSNPEIFGVFEIEERNGKKQAVGLEEKPEKPKSNYVNTGAYLIGKDFFEFELKESARKELEITDYIKKLILGMEIECEFVEDYWIPITYPWHLLEANEFFVSKIKESKIEGTVEDNVTVKGKIILGKNSIIKNGTYIEGNVVVGENCVIGPNCHVRGNTSIGNNTKITQGAEIKNSIIGENCASFHLSYIGDSVIGDKVNVAAGNITANLRHDNENVFVEVKGKKIDSGRRKLGAIIGDNVHTGIGTKFYPGRKLKEGSFTIPGEIVSINK